MELTTSQKGAGKAMSIFKISRGFDVLVIAFYAAASQLYLFFGYWVLYDTPYLKPKQKYSHFELFDILLLSPILETAVILLGGWLIKKTIKLHADVIFILANSIFALFVHDGLGAFSSALLFGYFAHIINLMKRGNSWISVFMWVAILHTIFNFITLIFTNPIYRLLINIVVP